MPPSPSPASRIALYHPEVEGSLRLADTSQAASAALRALDSTADRRELSNTPEPLGSSYLAWTTGESLICGSEGSAFQVSSGVLNGGLEITSKSFAPLYGTSDVSTLPDGRLLTSSLTAGVRLWSPVASFKSRSPDNPMSTLSIHAATAISGTSDCEGIMWGTQSGSVQLVKSSDMKGARYDWKVGGGGGPASQQRGGVASLRCTEIVGGNSFSVMTDDYSVFVGDVHACGKWTHIIPSEIVKGDGSHRTTSSLLAPSPCNESLLVAAVGPSRVIRFADVRQKKLLKDLKLALVPTSVSLRMDGAFMAVGSESAALVYDLRSLKSPIIKFEEVPARSLSFYRHYDYEEESHTPKASTPRGKQGVSKSLTPHTQRLAGMLKRIGAPARPTNSDTTNNSFKSNLPSAAQSSHFLDESSRQLIVDNSSNNGDDEGGEDDGDKSPTDTSFVVADRRGSQSSAGGISMRKLTLSGGEGGAACSTADIEMLVSSLNRMHVETIGKLRYLEMRQTKMENTLASILERLDK